MFLSWKKTNIFFKMSILPEVIYTLNAFHIKNTMELKKKKENPKIHMEPKWTLNSKSILGKNKSEGLTLPDLKSYYKAITN